VKVVDIIMVEGEIVSWVLNFKNVCVIEKRNKTWVGSQAYRRNCLVIIVLDPPFGNGLFFYCEKVIHYSKIL